ncbi:MAG: hypothetical protein OXF01_17035 [Gemmatimonadetes bacterium]|nr:hypothetical protein [Gemmatimonadota bacterium]
MIARYRLSALTENSSALLLRLFACLVRHRIEIVGIDCTNPADSAVYELELTVRADADHVRRAVKQIGAFVGVVEIDYRMEEDDRRGGEVVA